MPKTYTRGEYYDHAMRELFEQGIWPARMYARLSDVQATAQLYDVGQPALEWTTEAPTEPGWYWYNGPELSEIWALHVTYYNTKNDADGLEAWIEDGAARVSELSGKWAGPILPPK